MNHIHLHPFEMTGGSGDIAVFQFSQTKVVYYIFAVILNQASHLYRLTGSCM